MKYNDSRCKKFLSKDFNRKCAYCKIREGDLAGPESFEKDHFFPIAKGGKDDYENLYYSCVSCNGKAGKSDTWSQTLLDPCKDDIWNYLYTQGYEIKEFPRILARPPVEPTDFTYRDIRNRIIALGRDDKGTVRYATRRDFVAELTFKQKTCNIEVNDSINHKFIEISTRQASFNSMHTDEKLAEIANLIENMLKKDGEFIALEYEKVCCGFIDDAVVRKYRKKMQCFRHCTDEAITERKSYSEEQKNFLVDYGLTIVKAIHELIA